MHVARSILNSSFHPSLAVAGPTWGRPRVLNRFGPLIGCSFLQAFRDVVNRLHNGRSGPELELQRRPLTNKQNRCEGAAFCDCLGLGTMLL